MDIPVDGTLGPGPGLGQAGGEEGERGRQLPTRPLQLLGDGEELGFCPGQPVLKEPQGPPLPLLAQGQSGQPSAMPSCHEGQAEAEEYAASHGDWGDQGWLGGGLDYEGVR